MVSLSNLENTTAKRKQLMRVGRGVGSGKGKTSGRGQKGQGARSGAKKRHGYEGGQFRLYMKLPNRGFSRARFRVEWDAVNFYQIEQSFNDGDVVNRETLLQKGIIDGKGRGVKLLADGDLNKKVSFEVNAISEGARTKLEKAKLKYEVV